MAALREVGTIALLLQSAASHHHTMAVAGMMLLAYYGGVALLGASHGKSFGGNIGWENFLPMGGARPMGAFLTFDNLAPKAHFSSFI